MKHEVDSSMSSSIKKRSLQMKSQGIKKREPNLMVNSFLVALCILYETIVLEQKTPKYLQSRYN